MLNCTHLAKETRGNSKNRHLATDSPNDFTVLSLQ